MTGAPRATIIDAAHLTDPDSNDRGWVRVHDGVVVARGRGAAPDSSRIGADQVHVDRLMPGLVDIHVHGAKGADFSQVGSDPAPAIAHHHALGSTTLIASLATGSLDSTARRLGELQPFVASGDLAGIHLEGPWLSPQRRGAHAPELLRTPEPRDVKRLLEAGGGSIRMVTLAPELPGAFETISLLRRHGIVAAIGHTDADADTTARAIDAGASVITHLFNGMAPLHHRRPGVVGVALARPDVTVELIADGVHVDDTVAQVVFRSAADRLVLVSDAMAATGLGDGAYELAGSRVVVQDGIARLADGSSLAGSTSPLGSIVTRLVQRGEPAPSVVAAASVRPAAALGITAPALRVGDRADLVVATPGGEMRTMRGGRWLDS